MRDPTPPEWLALLAGVKPALRLLRDARRAQAEAAAARRRGFAVELVALGARAIVYVARTPAAARAVRDAEAAALPGQPPRARFDPTPHEALGALLGFPPCCVAAFVARIARGADVAADGGRAHEDWIAATEAAARSAALDARANVFERDHLPGWLSHEPCRFDCPASLAYADRVIAVARAHDRVGADHLARRLAAPVAIARDGRRGAPGATLVDACVLAFGDPA